MKPEAERQICFGKSHHSYLVEVESEEEVRAIAPNTLLLECLDLANVIVTSRSEKGEYDFVSRYFAPAHGISEDAVTGSAHCTLGPYWQARLGQSDFTAYQASSRGGIVKLNVRPPRVLLRGQAVTMGRVEWTE